MPLVVHPGADPDDKPTTLPEGHYLAAILLAIGQRPDLGKFSRRNRGKARPLNSPERVVDYGDFPGGADITGFLPNGRRVELEVKTPTGRQNPDQRRFQAVCEEYGVLYAVVTTPEDALAVLARALAAGPAARLERSGSSTWLT